MKHWKVNQAFLKSSTRSMLLDNRSDKCFYFWFFLNYYYDYLYFIVILVIPLWICIQQNYIGRYQRICSMEKPKSITEKFIFIFTLWLEVTHALLVHLPFIFKVLGILVMYQSTLDFEIQSNFCCIVSEKMCSSKASHSRQKKNLQNQITKFIKLF